MSSKYPNEIDLFIDKINQTDTQVGDDVMAEDVNNLQDAIVAIQTVLGINPQGSSTDLSKRLLEIDKTKVLTVPKVTIYGGDPKIVDGATTVDVAARNFSYFNHVILSNADTTNATYISDTRAVIESARTCSSTMFYGYIDAGWGLTEEALALGVDRWISAGVDGIYLDNFGYDSGLTRVLQNSFLEIVHNKGMLAILHATSTDDIFGTWTANGKNPDGIEIGLTSSDAVLITGFVLNANGYQAYNEVMNAADIIRYRASYGCKIYAIGYIDETDAVTANNMYQYGQAVAMLYSLDAFHTINSTDFFTDGSVQTYPTIPISGAYYETAPVVVADGQVVTRDCSAGSITIDLTNHVYSFNEIKIPLRFIDLDDGTLIPGSKISGLSVDVVAEINNKAADASINPLKINFNADAAKKIILALNLTAGTSTDPKINSGVLGPIASDKIQDAVLIALRNNLDELLLSGDFSGNFKYFTADIVSALNLHADNLTVESTSAEYLNGRVIRAGTIKADMISTGEITSDKLSIHANAGVNKWAGTIVKKATAAPEVTYPTVEMILGKDAYRRAETIDALNINTFDGVGASLQDYLTMWKTSVFCTDDVTFNTLRFKADSPATLYVNGTIIGTTTDWTNGIVYNLVLKKGWNDIVVVQDHMAQTTCTFTIGIKLSDYALQTEKGINTKVARVDAYAEVTTQIVGNQIKTGSIDAEQINTEGLGAALIEAGLITAMEAYIDKLVATDGDFERILADMLQSDYINTSNIRVMSEARTTLTDPLLESNTGVLMIDNGGMIVSSKPRAEIVAVEEALTLVGDYTYSAVHNDWVPDIGAVPTIYLKKKSDGTISNVGSDWYYVKYREGNVVIQPAKLTEKGVDLALYDICADYTYYSPTWPADARLIKLDRLGLWISENGGGTWTSKITGAGLRITGSAEIADAVISTAHISSLSADVLNTGELSLEKGIGISAQDGYVYFDANGLVIKDSLTSPLKIVRISKTGIEISQDSGQTWSTKLTGDRLFVTMADIDEIDAGKIVTSTLKADTTIMVGNDVSIDGNAGIKVAGTLGAGIEITEGTLQVTELGTPRVKVGRYDLTNYGVQILTTDNAITLNKDGLATANNKFKIKADGTIEAIDGNFTGAITATSGTFTGTVNAESGRFGAEANHIAIDNVGLVLGTGSIVDTRSTADQKLKIDSNGIVAKAGTIGGLEINSAINGLVARVDAIQNYSLTPTKLTVSGSEAVTIDSGSLIVKNGSNTYLTLGLMGTTYGLKMNLFDTIGAANGKYIQLDQDGFRAFNGTINTVNISRDGNIKIVGEVEATSGKLGTLAVNGTITVGSGGSVVAGPVTLNDLGLTGPGFELKSSESKIGGWVIGTSTISSGNLVIDSINEKITTSGVIFGKYDTDSYGIKAGTVTMNNLGLSGTNFSLTDTGINATGGKVGGWNISANRLYTSSILMDSSAQTITINDGAAAAQVVLGKYDGINYGLAAGTGLVINGSGITATAGTIGGWSLSADELSWADAGSHTGIHLSTSQIWMGHDALSSNATISFSADGSGKIGVVEFNKVVNSTNYSLYTPNFNIDSNGNVSITGNVTASSGTFTGTIHATAGWFGTDAANSVSIDGSGLKAGNVAIKNNGISVGLTDANGVSTGSLSINEAGLVVTESANGRSQINFNNKFVVNSAGGMTAEAGKIANWNISTNAIYTGTSTSSYNILIDSAANKIQIKDQVTIGLYDATNYGIKAGNVVLNSLGLTGPNFSLKSTGSLISGWTISATELSNGYIHLDSGNQAIWTGSGEIGLAKVRFNSDGSGKIGALQLNTGGYTILSDNFKVSDAGDVTITGAITATSGTFTGTVHATSGWFGTDAANSVTIGSGGIVAGDVTLNNTGLSVALKTAADLPAGTITLSEAGLVINETTGGRSQINLNGKFIADSNGGITATAGTIGGWTITDSTISARNVTLNSLGIITVGTNIALNDDGSAKLGKLNVGADGSLTSPQFSIDINGNASFSGDITGANGTFSGVLSATSGSIGGITINENSISTPQFTLHSNGLIEAQNVNVSGTVSATAGQFGVGAGAIKATSSGIYAGNGVGDPASTFWISSVQMEDPRNPSNLIHAGDAFFNGSVSVSQDSIMDGGDLVIQEGSIIAGSSNAAHVRMSYIPESGLGGEIYSQNASAEVLFRVNNTGAYFKGDMTATSGSILGDLAVGPAHTVYLSGNDNAIYLYNEDKEQADRIVRLNNDGLYISEDGGLTYSAALTGGGINANIIRDGILTISDSGSSAAGISIQQWNDNTNSFQENISITPDGIHVYNGAITVYSDTSGEVLIGGGYLRVKGLDMGVVTSNNYVGNGNFGMVSEDYGVMQLNQGEIFLGKAQSSGGAVSNPTYHYAGWPDYGSRYPHTIMTFKIDAGGTVAQYDPTLLTESTKWTGNYPNVARVSFNPQWCAVHPTYGHVVVPNDACNFVTVTSKDGDIIRQLKAWRGGLYGADFTPDGNKLIVCGDDIDRKRAPWDMVIFDTSSSDPNDWTMIGNIPVGEFPSKVVCDDQGFAYVTVSLDNTIYKLDLNNVRVDSVMTVTDPRGMVVTPMPIDISNDYQYIFVGGVVSDFVYRIPTSFDVPFTSCKRYSVTPYVGNRGIVHDVKVMADGYLVTSSASTTDACITVIDPDATVDANGNGAIVTWIDSTCIDRLAIPEGATDEQKAKWNFYSSTSVMPHPTLKRVYVTVTNRCVISTLDYTSGQLIEINRVPTGSNPSGVNISEDGTRLYVPNHHYHTYPLGANKVWGYRSSDNYYATDDIFDTSQKYYHYNPSGMITTDSGRYVWVANRATNNICIIDSQNWALETSRTYIENIGNKPYEMKLNPSKTKLYVSNDDSDGKNEPDFVTIVDVATKSIDGRIYVGDRPMGIEVDSSGQYVYVACHDGKMVQKASASTKKVVASAYFDGKPMHLKLTGTKLYVTCFDTDELYCINTNDFSISARISIDNGPSQMEVINGKLYVVCQGADNVMVFDVATNTLEQRIQVGSRPNPIAYNAVKNLIYVGNSGEGSVCIIDPTTNAVVEWCMTGDNPEFIMVTEDGNKWYVSAHGPEDIVYYGTGTPYTGDAYVDNESDTHKYGSTYWMPSRSKWTRGSDNTLTSFSSVEFWPEEKLQGKQGYAHITVMGMYNSFAQVEQDAYALVNLSDGSCEFKTEEIELEEGVARQLTEDIADYSDIPGYEKRKVILADSTDTSVRYVEGVHYSVDYDKKQISRLDSTIPPSNIRVNSGSLVGTTPLALITDGFKYNTITVYPLNQTTGAYIEGTDYLIDRVGNTIERTASSNIPDGASVTITYRHLLKCRYYYHPNKRNYSDVVLSSDIFWKWPRPENQWVRMEIDELVPKFIYVDNDNIDPWTPTFDCGKGSTSVTQYKGLRYSSNTNRTTNANITTSAAPINGTLVDNAKVYDGYLELPEGAQSITVDIGATYYVNEIYVIHALDGRTVNDVTVDISTDGTNWTNVYTNATAPASYTITFPKTYGITEYNGGKRVRYVRCSSNGSTNGTTNVWKQVKVMGDWKASRSYTFSSNTIWDSEGKREVYLSMTDVTPIRFDNPGFTTTPSDVTTPVAQRVRYRVYYTNPDKSHNVRGSVQVFNMFTGEEYVGLRSDLTPVVGTHYDFRYDYIDNTIWRTADSNIASGQEVRIIMRYVQEQLSNLPLCIAYRDPSTGNTVPSIPATVAETDTTGAWVEWEFENKYRCDWYIGWVADIGLGTVEIYLDDKLVHTLSQSAAKVERFSQLTQDLLPGSHKIRLVQQQGRVNFDIIKLEDYQLYFTNSSLVASPSLNPVELFTWYTAKITPSKARKYLGRGTQTMSGAYDTLRMDKETVIPNAQVPIKYRVRFKTTLEGRGEPVDGEGSYGGEAVGNEFKFERGSVMVTSVTLEKGSNPTYWRMAPAADLYPGFTIEGWDISKPNDTGIQTYHLADGVVTSAKIKHFAIRDEHIANDAAIQESKLLLNYPTHPHANKETLDMITGLGASGTSTNVAREDHNHDAGVYKVIHRRPIYGYGGDLQFQTDSVAWEDLVSAYNLLANGLPDPAEGYTRYYRLYAVYGDNITASDTVAGRIRIVQTDNTEVYNWKTDYTYGTANGRRDAFSPYFQTPDNSTDHKVQICIQNDAGTYAGGEGKEIGLEWLELIAYDKLT